MTTNQKLELSRELRQWFGVVISVASIGVTAFAILFPEKTNKICEKIEKKVMG